MDRFSGGFHLGPQALVHVREFIEREDRDLDGVSFQFFLKFKVLDLMRTQHHLCGKIQERHTVSLGNEWRRPGCARICLDHIDFFLFIPFGGGDGKLDIDQPFCVQCEGQLARILNHCLDGFLTQAERWQDRRTVARVDPRRLDVFHDAHDQDILPVADGVDLGLMRPFKELVDEHPVIREVFVNAQDMPLQFLVIDDDSHALAAQNIGRPDQYRVSDTVCYFQCLVDIMCHAVFRIGDTQFLE